MPFIGKTRGREPCDIQRHIPRLLSIVQDNLNDDAALIVSRMTVDLWDPDEYLADDLIRACLLEVGNMQPKLQSLGSMALLDCESLTMEQMRQSSSIAVQAMNIMGGCLKMPFLDIAFQAELSRYEDPEFEAYAKKNCNEDPDTRAKVVEELRRLIRERGEINPRRMDDAYCLRFLRCRRFIPALAHRLMVRYEEFRRQNAYLYECDAFGLQKVKHVYGGTLPESPTNGRIILMRFGRWDVDAVPIVDVVRCALLMDEVAVMQPKLQILGVTIIVDLEGLNLRHVAQLTPTVAGQIVSLMGVSFPLANHCLHIINYNWLLHSIFYLFKQFIPKAVFSRLHFHGSDMNSLHKHIDPAYLPPEYGGHCQYVISTEEWIAKLYEYRDDFLVQELRALGFTVRG